MSDERRKKLSEKEAQKRVARLMRDFKGERSHPSLSKAAHLVFILCCAVLGGMFLWTFLGESNDLDLLGRSSRSSKGGETTAKPLFPKELLLEGRVRRLQLGEDTFLLDCSGKKVLLRWALEKKKLEDLSVGMVLSVKAEIRGKTRFGALLGKALELEIMSR